TNITLLLRPLWITASKSSTERDTDAFWTRLVRALASLGAPIDGSSFNKWHWGKVRKEAKLPEGTRFHDLRHTFVSRALAAGANLRAVSEMVGHHDPGFTARRYAHALQDDKKEAVRLLHQYLNRTATVEADSEP